MHKHEYFHQYVLSEIDYSVCIYFNYIIEKQFQGLCSVLYISLTLFAFLKVNALQFSALYIYYYSQLTYTVAIVFTNKNNNTTEVK